MEEAVQQAVGGEGDAAAAATAALLAAVKARSLDVLGLVGLLKRPLTDEHDHEGRARAVQLLSQVAVEAPEALLLGDVAVMAEFLGSKLQDWRCVGAAVPGCAALLARHGNLELAQLPQPAALALIASVTGVHVQGLDHVGRKASYQLLLEVLQGPFAVPAVLAGTDLVTYTVVAVENEVDFFCLQLALQCVQAVGRLYQAPALAHARHLTDGLEDLFDVGVAPYFPLMFTPPKNNPQRISRPQLLGHVIGAMACCPQFAALAVPLLSEKLGSSLQQAKADVLQALPVCVEAWGRDAVRPHLQAVWLMLKAELMAPAAEGLTPEAAALRQAGASAAAAALGRCVAALGSGLLDKQVLSDVAVEDLQQYLGLVNPPWAQQQQQQQEQQAGNGTAASAASAAWDLPERAQRRLACIASAVAAVAAAGGPSCNAVVTEVLRPALTAVLHDGSGAGVRPLQANCGVLCLLHAVASAVEAAPAPAAAAASLAQLVPDAAAVLQQLQARLQQPPAAELPQAEQLHVWVLLVWRDLFSLHLHAPCLQQQHFNAASQLLLQQALHGSADAVLLPPGIECSVQGAALAALRQLAQLQDQQQPSAPAALSSMLQRFATPPLLQLLSQPRAASGAAEQQQLASRAVQLLQQLAGSNGTAAWQVLQWLQPTVLQQVRGNQAGLAGCLAILQAHCLPVLPAELPPQQSAEAAGFCAALLEAWQQRWQQQQQQQESPHAAANSSSSEVTSSLFVAQLLAKCRAQEQQQLMVTGCEWTVAAAAALQQQQQQQQQGSGPAGLAAAVLATVRPGLLTASSVLDLAAALAHISSATWHTDTSSSSSSSSSGSGSSSNLQWASLAAGVALAGIINKAISHQTKQAAQAGVSADALLAAVLPLLVAPLQQLQQQAGESVTAMSAVEQQQAARAALGATHALAWLARALAMQRHEAWLQCMHPVLELLALLPVLQPAGGCNALQQLPWAAVQGFAVLVASGNAAAPCSTGAGVPPAGGSVDQQQVQLGAEQLGLQLSLHMTARPLWQQRAFVSMLQSLLAATAPGGVAATAKQQQQQLHEGEAGAGPWLAAACLLSAAPAAVVEAEGSQALPLLLQCLARLRSLWEAGGACGGGLRLLQLLQSCLGMVGQALLAGGERCELLAQVSDELVNVLCGLARLLAPPPGDAARGAQRQQLLLAAAGVREAALACLAACITGLPYHLLHPHKRRVLGIVADALDDDRRAVRRAAVAARASWSGGP